MTRSLMAVALLLIAQPAFAEERATPLADYLRANPLELTAAVQSEPPTTQRKLQVAFGIASMTAIGIATGATAICYVPNTGCHEVNRVLDWAIKGSLVRAVVIKPLVGGGLLYVVWRFMPDGKWKTLTLGGLAALNGWDAAHDIRIIRRLKPS